MARSRSATRRCTCPTRTAGWIGSEDMGASSAARRAGASAESPIRAAGSWQDRPMGAAAPDAALVGRARERASIGAALAALGAGGGRVLLLVGEPGIGKSRLLAHLGERARAAGAVVLAGRTSEFEADLPFAALTEALEPHLAALGERAAGRLGLADPAALAAVAPVPSAAAEPSAAGDRHRVHRALRDLLGALSAARPLVLAVDDVHWADP